MFVPECNILSFGELLRKSIFAFRGRIQSSTKSSTKPLEDNAGIKVTQGCLMADELNMNFSSASVHKGRY